MVAFEIKAGETSFLKKKIKLLQRRFFLKNCHYIYQSCHRMMENMSSIDGDKYNAVIYMAGPKFATKVKAC
jgi:hypothetical protein